MKNIDRVMSDPAARRMLLDRLFEITKPATIPVMVRGDRVPIRVTPARKVAGRLVRVT